MTVLAILGLAWSGCFLAFIGWLILAAIVAPRTIAEDQPDLEADYAACDICAADASRIAAVTARMQRAVLDDSTDFAHSAVRARIQTRLDEIQVARGWTELDERTAFVTYLEDVQ